ncbi:DUF92 domain-containing protein [Rapidithrix thailandica]|uniref:DUF92 domain-containing protein n=1 Tax=Rapidithrix thailandica TaxID=413964 RepID=A0AAW9RZM8_9BACT
MNQLTMPENWPIGFVVIAVSMAMAYLGKKLDLLGALVGGGIALCIFMGVGFKGLFFLFVFFVLGTGASHWKFKEKEKLQVAEKNKGRRSVANALANGGVAATCGLLAWLFPMHQELFTGMIAAAFASATADTLSSELGNLYGSRYVNILSFRPDQRGLDGVISLEGTVLGTFGSALLALSYGFLYQWSNMVVFVFLAGVIGNFMDSYLGATLQRNGYLNNHTVNLANTLAAVLFVWLCL